MSKCNEKRQERQDAVDSMSLALEKQCKKDTNNDHRPDCDFIKIPSFTDCVVEQCVHKIDNGDGLQTETIYNQPVSASDPGPISSSDVYPTNNAQDVWRCYATAPSQCMNVACRR